MKRPGRESGKPPRHVRLYHYLMATDAWRDLSGNARAIYVMIAARYMSSNNGRIPFAVREAASELKIGVATASRELQSLQDHGFIVPTKKGSFSLKVRHASEWRLTEFPDDSTGAMIPPAATKEFARWTPEKQKPVSVMKLSVSKVEPIGSRHGTTVAELARTGS